VTTSTAKGGDISAIVPFVTHVDHANHDVDVIITEQGFADLRGKSPREIAQVVIDNCVHPKFKEQARDYVKRANEKGGQTPHILAEAFSWHDHYAKHGTMLLNEKKK